MALPANFFSTQSVLVVDDIDTIRSAVKGMLQMLGCKDIAIASNGDRALELCEVAQFDFILCDFNLGKGKDGYQLFEELKLRDLMKPSTVFILISAETALQVVHGLVELQPDDYLLKPFSYKTLEARLVRALEKRKVLGGIYDSLAVKDYKKALYECGKASKGNHKYSLSITRLKGEVLLNLHQPQSAFDLYDSILEFRDFSWAKLGKAIAYYHLGDYTNSAKILNELCELPETRIEALNWLSSIYAQRECYSQAKEILVESVKLSPKNIPRQRALANLSLLEGDWEIAQRCFKTVLDNTRFSVHEHIKHHFNYIHCILDKVTASNELQQAKVFSQTQAILKSASLRFDKDRFHELEKVVFTRIMVMKKLLKSAAESLHDVDVEMVISCGRDSGLALAKAWFELGNYEKYDEIMALIDLPENDNSIEMMSELLVVKKVEKETKDKIAKLLALNEQGIKLFKSGLYPASSTVFLEAHEIMPNNVQLALNLGQSMTKGWPPNESFPVKKRVAKHCINVIEANQLDELSGKRYRAIEKELKAI
ncbi:tetratricopeptide repeat-containing response regulator [Psychromonas hadalis]|uniref:tetratricopeptide repeat-containing response regulator n=1 Tax=Psychromonas hadalis TaxID=211669 RepID=UPI0003B6F676|nr:tetratricopeptide repeat-containing response regulator [Psychromonas hadalis]